MTHALSAVICAYWLVAGVAQNPPGTQPAWAHDLAALQQENAALRERIARLEAELGRLREDNRQLHILAGLTPPQDAAQAQAARVVTRTDPVSRDTTVSFPFERFEVVSGSREQHWMRLSYVQPADGSAPPQIDWHIFARLTPRHYAQLKQARLILDGQSFDIDVPKAQATMRSARGGAGNLYDEQLTLRVPLELLQQAARARDVQLRLRQVQLKLTPQQIAQFAAFQQRLSATAPR